MKYYTDHLTINLGNLINFSLNSSNLDNQSKSSLYQLQNPNWVLTIGKKISC